MWAEGISKKDLQKIREGGRATFIITVIINLSTPIGEKIEERIYIIEILYFPKYFKLFNQPFEIHLRSRSIIESYKLI